MVPKTRKPAMTLPSSLNVGGEDEDDFDDLSPIDGRPGAKSIEYGLDKSQRRRHLTTRFSEFQ